MQFITKKQSLRLTFKLEAYILRHIILIIQGFKEIVEILQASQEAKPSANKHNLFSCFSNPQITSTSQGEVSR